jgi:hypothetical protein
MKASVPILACSALVNVALVAAFVVRPMLVPPAVRELFQSTRSEAVMAAAAREQIRASAGERAAIREAEAQRAAAARQQLWTALDSDDLPTLVSRLRAAGFSRAVIVAMLNAKLDSRSADRLRAVVGDIENLPFWKPDPTNSPNNRSFFEQYSQIYRERAKIMRELLGDDALAWGGVDPAAVQRRQFGSIAKEKIDHVQRISDDYAELISQVRAGMQGIALPEDRESMALLEREKRADLAAVLTPAELEEYEMRTSPITSRLRNALTLLDSSAEEFRTVFEVHQQFNDRINPPGGVMSSALLEERREAQRQLNEQLQAALGANRFAEYARASSSEFQQLHRIAQKENIPAETAIRAFSVREQIGAESTRILEDGALSNDQKRAALGTLAQNARTQINSTLGTTAGEAYLQIATRWLSYLERGTAFTIGPDGNPSLRGLPAPPPPGR